MNVRYLDVVGCWLKKLNFNFSLAKGRVKIHAITE